MDYSICCVKGCDEPSVALGLCNKHWRRNKMYGSPVAQKTHNGMFAGKSPEERFAMQYKVAESGCWNWTSGKDKDGYGMFRAEFDGVVYKRAHRWSWAFHNKEQIPKYANVCHSCDNPSCVNPAHLWIGSVKDNQRDKWAKGRGRMLRGDELPQAKLNEDQALSILKDPRPYAAIAADYGVTASTINDIKGRKSWAHLVVDYVVKGKRTGRKSDKITPDIVREIRSSDLSGKELAAKFGISPQQVCGIRKRRAWAHID